MSKLVFFPQFINKLCIYFDAVHGAECSRSGEFGCTVTHNAASLAPSVPLTTFALFLIIQIDLSCHELHQDVIPKHCPDTQYNTR